MYFRGAQKDFVDTEKALGRASAQVSAVVGYAGGTQAGPDGKVCMGLYLYQERNIATPWGYGTY